MTSLETETLTSVNDRAAPPSRPAALCPICEGRTLADYAPFCSKRCADVDLHRWLSGSYAIPAVEDESGGESDETEH